MNTVTKKNIKYSFIPIFIMVLFSACQKESLINPIKKELELKVTAKPIAEKVDNQLLEKYVAYESKMEAITLLKGNGVPTDDVQIPKLQKNEFEAMINSFLANERNEMREAYFMKKNNSSVGISNFAPIEGDCYDSNGDPIDCGSTNSGGSGGQVSCKGNFTGFNTINTVLFIANLNNSGNSISTNSFAFGGFSGTMSPLLTINQSLFQNVITYNQYYSETINLPNGGSYTQLYYLYGNIYNGACTVHGIQVITP